MNIKRILWIAAALLVLFSLVIVFSDSCFPMGSKNLPYMRHSRLGTVSKDKEEVFADSAGDIYMITRKRNLLRRRGRHIMAENVQRADANAIGLVWLNEAGELYLHSKGEVICLSHTACDFAVNEDSIFYYTKDGNLHICTSEKTDILFTYPSKKYPSPNPRTMDILANNRWVFLADTGEEHNCYYDLIQDCLFTLDEAPYYESASGTAILWGDSLLCFMGYKNGGVGYHLEDGIAQPLDLGIEVGEHDVRGCATVLEDTLYLSLQYIPWPQFQQKPYSYTPIEGTYALNSRTLEIERINDAFYKQLFATKNQILGITGQRTVCVNPYKK